MLKMLRLNQRISNMLFGSLDVVVIIIVFFISAYLVNTFTPHLITYNNETFFVLTFSLFTWILLLKIIHLARIPRTSAYIIIFVDFVKLSITGCIIMLCIDWIITLDSFPSTAILIFSGLNLFTLYVIRILTFKWFKIYRANGHSTRNVIIMAGNQSTDIINKIIKHKEWGFRILSILTDSDNIRNEFAGKLRTYPVNINIRSLMQYDIIDELICCDPSIKEKKIHELLNVCKEIGVIFRIHTKRKLKTTNKSRIYYFDKTPFYTVETTPRNSIGQNVKYISEIILAFSILFILSPFLLFISLAILCTSRGPVIFKQQRVGLRGRKFYIYKFRTMVSNAEKMMTELEKRNESDGPVFKIKKDPRITFVGRILRKTGLDELPQLFNVIRGEMSIIGPRPPLPTEVEEYKRWQLKRLSVKPGITCSWQILPNRNDVKFENWMQLDIQYIENWSLKKDLQLFFKTFGSILHARGY